MKKLGTNVLDTNTELRRSSRNKLSTSGKRQSAVNDRSHNPHWPQPAVKGDSSVSCCINENLQSKLLKKRELCVSPKKELPLIVESPSHYQRQSPICTDNSKLDIVTPKSDRTHSFIDTPFKDEVLVCSQHFDSQSDVAWDCRSPDAVILRRGSRRRHYSDVSNIITQLHVCEDDEEPTDTSRKPLAGLWVNDSSTCTIRSDQNTQRDRRRKNRTKAKAKPTTGNVSLSDALAEKLRLALEKCEESPCKGDVATEDVRKRSASVGDESRDVLESQLNNDNQNIEESWSDDELFEDDSFIIKATQLDSEPKSNKRKLDSDINEEPPVKSGKYLENQKSVNKSGNLAVTCTRFSKITSKASPFKKHRSFNDRHEYEKSQEKERKLMTQYNEASYVGKVSVSFPNQQTSVSKKTMCVVSTPSKLSTSSILNISRSRPENRVKDTLIYSSISVRNQCVPKSSVKKSSSTFIPRISSQIVSEEEKFPNTSQFRLNYSRAGSNVSHIAASSNKNSGACISTQPSFNGTKQTLLTTQISINCTVPTSQPGRFCDTRNGLSHRLNNSSISVNKTVTNGISSSECSTVFSNHTPSMCARSTTGMAMSNAKTVLTTMHNGNVAMISRSNVKSGFSKINNTNQMQSPCSRRSSGTFDTSLSDDLLCQLTELDNVLESQVCTDVEETCDIDDALSFFLEIPKTKSNTVSDIKSAKSNERSHENKLSKKNGACLSSQSAKCISKNINKENLSSTVGKQDENKTGQKTILTQNSITSMKGGKYTMDFSVKGLNNEHTCDTVPSMKTESVGCRQDFLKQEKDHMSTPSISTSYKLRSRTPKSAFKTKSVCAMENASEDLFMSDEDELSERQMWEILDDVESTQTASLPGVLNKTLIKKLPPKNPVSGKTFKYSPDEIEKKRLDALKRKQLKEKQSYQNSTQCTDNELCTPPNSQPNKSPFKCSPDEIEMKRLEALHRKEQRESKTKHPHEVCQVKCELSCTLTTPTNSQPSNSPFKCSPEHIEKKRQAALMNRHLKFEKSKTDTQIDMKFSDIGNCTSSLKGVSEIVPVSPLKCSQEEIENKRKEALKRLQARKGENNQEPKITPVKSSLDKFPMKCSPEDIEKKRQAALLKRQQKPEQESIVGQANPDKSTFASSLDVVERKRQEALYRKKLKFERTNITTSSSQNIDGTARGDYIKSQTDVFSDKKGAEKGLVSAEEIERKKQIALQKRHEKMKNVKIVK